MTAQLAVPSHIDITDALARLYVFLAQSMDHCGSEVARINYSNADVQSHLASAKATVMDMLAVNQVVQAKVEQECNHVHSLIITCLENGVEKGFAQDALKVERATLKHKTMALSDLLAVFRSA